VRVLSEVVDRVVAEHRAPGYGKRAAVAQELGVSSKTLKTLLKRAGVATVHRNDGGIPIEAARRVVAEHRGQVAA
jgi:AraC-like DNA-binding protein